jgi:TolB-like protein
VLTTPESLIALDLSDCLVDAVAVERLALGDITSAASEQLAATVALFGGDLLDGLAVEGAELAGWLVACRQRYRALHIALVGELALREAPDSDARLRGLETWLALAPFDHRAHEAMVETLSKTGHPRQAQDHVNRTIRAFEQEGLDWGPVRAAWQSARGDGKAVAAVEMTSAALSLPPATTQEAGLPRPGSVLIMPMGHHPPGLDQLASGLTEELVTRLAKLRVLFVIARGTSYALHARGLDAREAARLLNVEYVVSGTVRRQGDGLTIHVELVHRQDAGIVWADRADAMGAEPLAFMDATVDRIVAAIAEQIEQAECKRAIGKPPNSLDAWEAYHRGLWHMYLFTGSDNQIAQACAYSGDCGGQPVTLWSSRPGSCAGRPHPQRTSELRHRGLSALFPLCSRGGEGLPASRQAHWSRLTGRPRPACSSACRSPRC